MGGSSSAAVRAAKRRRDLFRRRGVVPRDFVDRIAAELLEEGVGEHEGDHRFADDRRGGHRADVAALDRGRRVCSVCRSTDRSGFISVAIGFMNRLTRTSCRWSRRLRGRRRCWSARTARAVDGGGRISSCTREPGAAPPRADADATALMA
jgi:hypothetical protein